MKKTQLLILGIGNILWAEEGFGVQWGIPYVPRSARVADDYRRALEMANYEAGRPSAELACRFGDERFLTGQA